MRRTSAALAATASFIAALALAGCSLSNISPSISNLAGESLQDALDSARSALDQANQALLSAAGELDEGMSELSDTLRNISDLPDLLASLFTDHDLANNSTRLELVDAQTQEVLASLDNASDLAGLGVPLATMDVESWKLVSSVPEGHTADRILRFYSKPTKTLLESSGQADTESLDITLYGKSSYATIYIPAFDLTLDFEVPQKDIDTLAALL